MALTRLAHQLIKEHFDQHRDSMKLAVDATCGNGFDTEFLLRIGFAKVVGVDIQSEAIAITSKRVQDQYINNVELYQQSHDKLHLTIKDQVNCFMFNLGYLPHGDKTITTTSKSTLSALNYCLNKLQQNGYISVLCYPGHEEGRVETNAIKNWLKTIDERFSVEQFLSSSPSTNSPILYTIKN